MTFNRECRSFGSSKCSPIFLKLKKNEFFQVFRIKRVDVRENKNNLNNIINFSKKLHLLCYAKLESLEKCTKLEGLEKCTKFQSVEKPIRIYHSSQNCSNWVLKSIQAIELSFLV